MENTLLAVSAPPFWHCGRTIDKAMRWMLAALMPAAIMAVVNWGIPALRVMALSTATAVAAEALACRLIHRPVRVDNLHGAIIGLLFAFLLPASALLGMAFVLACDSLGRVLFATFELPVGILMSFLGGPFFLFLLLRQKRSRVYD